MKYETPKTREEAPDQIAATLAKLAAMGGKE